MNQWEKDEADYDQPLMYYFIDQSTRVYQLVDCSSALLDTSVNDDTLRVTIVSLSQQLMRVDSSRTLAQVYIRNALARVSIIRLPQMLPTVAVQLISQLQMSDEGRGFLRANIIPTVRKVEQCGTQPYPKHCSSYTAKVAARMLRSCQGDAARTAPTPTQLASGFTLFEVLFVLIIVGSECDRGS